MIFYKLLLPILVAIDISKKKGSSANLISRTTRQFKFAKLHGLNESLLFSVKNTMESHSLNIERFLDITRVTVGSTFPNKGTVLRKVIVEGKLCSLVSSFGLKRKSYIYLHIF